MPLHPAHRTPRETQQARGFTYLEVLIALAILLGLSVAVSLSLGRVLGAEAQSVRIQEGGLALRSLSARRLGGRPAEANPPAAGAWAATPDPELETAGWELWRVEPADRPSLGFSAAVIATGRSVEAEPPGETP